MKSRSWNYIDRRALLRRVRIRPPEMLPCAPPDDVGFRIQCASLSKPDTRRSDNSQSAGEVHFEHFM